MTTESKSFLRKVLKQKESLEKTFRDRGSKFNDKFSKDLAASQRKDINRIKRKLKR